MAIACMACVLYFVFFGTRREPARDVAADVPAGRYVEQRELRAEAQDAYAHYALSPDAEGRYRFITIRPGAYPWPNHHKAFRPAHIHFSLLGPSFVTRLVTQMYFPGDPLLDIDPIFLSIPDQGARARLVAKCSVAETVAEWALAYEFDIVLRGRNATLREA